MNPLQTYVFIQPQVNTRRDSKERRIVKISLGFLSGNGNKMNEFDIMVFSYLNCRETNIRGAFSILKKITIRITWIKLAL